MPRGAQPLEACSPLLPRRLHTCWRRVLFASSCPARRGVLEVVLAAPTRREQNVLAHSPRQFSTRASFIVAIGGRWRWHGESAAGRPDIIPAADLRRMPFDCWRCWRRRFLRVASSLLTRAPPCSKAFVPKPFPWLDLLSCGDHDPPCCRCLFADDSDFRPRCIVTNFDHCFDGTTRFHSKRGECTDGFRKSPLWPGQRFRLAELMNRKDFVSAPRYARTSSRQVAGG